MQRSFRKAPRTPSPDWGDLDKGTPAEGMHAKFDQDRRALPLRHAAPPRQIDLTIRGEGPTLLFIPGSFSTGAAWRPVQAKLPFAARMATLSLCGYGQTDETRSLGNASIAHEVAVVQSALEQLATPVTLVAHSFGGVVALAAALRFPEQVAGLVLFEANPMDVLRLSGEDRLFGEAWDMASAFEVDVSRNVQDAPARIIDYWNGDSSFERLPDPVRAYCRQTAFTNVLDWRSDFGFAADDLSSIRCPVVVARGSLANPAMVAITDALARMLPCAGMSIIEGAGHFPIATHPAESAELVTGFVEQGAVFS
jgi:pimeloyl-ACP methyl ester carboxylesterase